MDTPNLREQFLNQNLKVLHRPTPIHDHSPYLPVFLTVLMVEERLTFPVYLKVSAGEEGEIKFLPYLEEGEVVQRAWMESLDQVGIDHLYIREKDVDRVVAYLNNHLLLASGEPEHKRKKFTLLREHLSFSLVRAFQAPHQGAHVGLAKKSLENLGKFMWQEGFPWNLVWEMLYRDYTLYSHSVNVGVMGMALMAYLKKPGRDGLTMGLAGLFHDLGMITFGEEFFHKAGPLDPEEREAMKKHPCHGRRLLQNNPQIPLDTLRLILEHHENANGTGYPQGLRLAQQHPHTRFLYILEAYDSLTNFRPYRAAYTPFAALKIFQEPSQGLVCEPRALKKFIQFLALA